MTKISAGDVGYHGELCGPSYESDQGPRPLLLLHGFTGCAGNWKPISPKLMASETGHDTRPIIAVDLLGHGQTEAPRDPDRYAIERAVADLEAVLDTLRIERTDLVGYSMGGRLALAFAVLAPGRVVRLVLESASPGLRTPDERTARVTADRALADSIERDGVPAFVDRWERLPLFASQDRLPVERREALRKQRLDNRASGLANSLRGMGTGAQPSFWEQLPSLQAPTLLITGEEDTKFCAIAEEMHALLSNGGPRSAPLPSEMVVSPCGDRESVVNDGGTRWSANGNASGNANPDRGRGRMGTGNRLRVGSPTLGATHCVVAGAGHTVHLEQSQQFAELVRRFLDGGSG